VTASSVVTPVVPPTMAPGLGGGRAPRPGTARRVLPLARLTSSRARSTVYGLATIDCNGRVAETVVINALGWVPGTRLDIRESGGLVLVTASRHGVFAMTGQGYLRLPATVRHWCGLVPGDRVMLAADPADGLLVVHPPAALDAMITQFHASVLGGEAA
jgi:hypothetical protein